MNGLDEMLENQGIVWINFLTGKKFHLAVWWPQPGKEKELKSEKNINLISASRFKDSGKMSPCSSPGDTQEHLSIQERKAYETNG